MMRLIPLTQTDPADRGRSALPEMPLPCPLALRPT